MCGCVISPNWEMVVCSTAFQSLKPGLIGFFLVPPRHWNRLPSTEQQGGSPDVVVTWMGKAFALGISEWSSLAVTLVV